MLFFINSISHLVLRPISPFLDKIPAVEPRSAVLFVRGVFNVRRVLRQHVLATTSHNYLPVQTGEINI